MHRLNAMDELSAQDRTARMVMLTYGRMQDGKTPFWCYVAVKPSHYDTLMEQAKAGTLNLQTYEEDGFGEILVSGPGTYPPTNITQQIARLFNTPIKDLFPNTDPKEAITRKIEELKKMQGDSNASST